MIAIQAIMDTKADILAEKGTFSIILCSVFNSSANLKMNLWKTNTLRAATANKLIFNQKVGSTPRLFALVINSNNPEGMTRSKPRLEKGNK